MKPPENAPIVAGHRFNFFDYCDCGRKWRDICGLAREEFVGAAEVAHTGTGNDQEWDQVQREIARRANQIVLAYGGRVT